MRLKVTTHTTSQPPRPPQAGHRGHRAAETLLISTFGIKSVLIEVVGRFVQLGNGVRGQSFNCARVAVLVVIRLNQGRLLKKLKWMTVINKGRECTLRSARSCQRLKHHR